MVAYDCSGAADASQPCLQLHSSLIEDLPLKDLETDDLYAVVHQWNSNRPTWPAPQIGSGLDTFL